MNKRAARIDLHFHLLPGVDDGPRTIDESLALAFMAARDGTRTIVATPHVRRDYVTDVSELPERVRELKAYLRKERIPIDVRCGAELGHDFVGSLRQEELETVAQGPAGARWVLLETPFERIGADLHEAADELRDRGFAVLLAHPERSTAVLADDGPALRRELAAGSLLQVNVWSLAGQHGDDVRAAAAALVESGRAAIVASDAHADWRRPELSRGLVAAMGAGLPAGEAQSLVGTSPRRLLERGLPIARPVLRAA
jgi:protein-tyrosine phosphatase